MDDIGIIVTGAGAPGVLGTLSALECEGLRFRIIGVDVDPDASARHLFDEFHRIPRPEDERFIPELLRITRDSRARVIIPQVTKELPVLSDATGRFEEIGCSVLVNRRKNIELLNDKHELLDTFKDLGLPFPEYLLAKDTRSFLEAAKALGYPEKRVVVKLPVSNGMRGLRILDSRNDKRGDFLNRKPEGVVCDLDEFLAIFGGTIDVDLLVMEYLPGTEVSVDCLARKGEPVIILPRTRDKIRTGITFQGTSVRNGDIISMCETLIMRLGLDHMFGFQFKLNAAGFPMVIESNPRIQGTMVFGKYCNANVILGAVKQALGMETGLRQGDVVFGVRLDRLWGGLFTQDGKLLGKF